MHKKQAALGKMFVYPYKDTHMRSFTIAKDMTSFETDHLIIGMSLIPAAMSVLNLLSAA